MNTKQIISLRLLAEIVSIILAGFDLRKIIFVTSNHLSSEMWLWVDDIIPSCANISLSGNN